MPTDTSKFVPADRLTFEQEPIDMKAPILLRPLGDDPKDKRNWVLKAIERTGQPLDAALTTWAFGFGLEDDLMWDATVEYMGEEEARRHHAEVWRRIPEKFKDAAEKCSPGRAGRPPTASPSRSTPTRSSSRLGLSKEDALDPLEPGLHRPRPPDVARLGGPLRRPRGRDHVLPRVGGLRTRVPRRDQGRGRYAGVQDDRRSGEAQPRVLGGNRLRGRGRRADRRIGSSRSSRPARTSTTWSTCTGRRRRAR